MPSIITRGAGSVRGFGGFGAVTPAPPPPPPPPPPPGPATVTFTSSGYWVADTTLVNALSGQGAAGTPAGADVWEQSILGAPAAWSFRSSQFTGSVDATPYYYQVAEYGEGIISEANYSTAARTITFSVASYYWNPATNGTYYSGDFVSLYVRGLVSKAGSVWNNTSGDPVQGLNVGWYLQAETLVSQPETTGASSYALGREFPGGVGGEATPVGYSNVGVSYGTSYYIDVAPGGYVTLEYYAS